MMNKSKIDKLKIFDRLPYKSYKHEIYEYKLICMDDIKTYSKIYIVHSFYGYGYSDYYWTTNLENKIVRGTVCLMGIFHNKFNEKLCNYLNIEYDSEKNKYDESKFDELCLNSIWLDIKNITSFNQEMFTCKKLIKQKYHSVDFNNDLFNILEIIDENIDQSCENILDMILEYEKSVINSEDSENISDQNTLKDFISQIYNLCDVVEKLNYKVDDLSSRVEKIESIKNNIKGIVDKVIMPVEISDNIFN